MCGFARVLNIEDSLIEIQIRVAALSFQIRVAALLGPRLLQVLHTRSHPTSHVQYQSSQSSVYLKAHLTWCIRVSWTVHMDFSSFPTALELVQGPIWWFDLLEFLYHSKRLSPTFASAPWEYVFGAPNSREWVTETSGRFVPVTFFTIW